MTGITVAAIPVTMSKIFSGARMRELREAKGLSCRALARAAGVKPQTASDMERGLPADPGGNKIAAIATVLGCQIDDLYEPANAPAPTQLNAPAAD